MQRVAPNRLLLCYGMVNVVLLSIAITSSGWIAIGALWLTTLFMSIMWPTVFALRVRDLGHLTNLGSSLMIMAIVGGAVFPPLMGYLADIMNDIQLSLIVPMAGFLVVIHYAAWGWRKRPTHAE